MLGTWVREKTVLSLEEAVRRMTSDPADFFGIKDRGRIAPGLVADVNVIDFERLHLHAPRMAFDLPAGGRRPRQWVGTPPTFAARAPSTRQHTEPRDRHGPQQQRQLRAGGARGRRGLAMPSA